MLRPVKFLLSAALQCLAAGRAFEQVRNSVGYPHLNVKIGATHAGITVGEDGATHQCNEDIALMRTIPGMVVMCPADDVEAKAAVKAAAEYEGPVYLRFGRAACPVINDRPDYKFEIGKGNVVREGSDVTIVATGICVGNALEAAEMLAADGISAEVINICTIKPLDEELIVKSAKKTGKVVTAEEHSVIGGLGSAVCDALCKSYPVPVKKIGMQDTFGESGSAAALVEKYQLDGNGIYAQVQRAFLNKVITDYFPSGRKDMYILAPPYWQQILQNWVNRLKKQNDVEHNFFISMSWTGFLYPVSPSECR